MYMYNHDKAIQKLLHFDHVYSNSCILCTGITKTLIQPKYNVVLIRTRPEYVSDEINADYGNVNQQPDSEKCK